MASSNQILVLSDIHFGDFSQNNYLLANSHTEEAAEIERAAAEIKEALSNNNLSPSIIAVPGDLTSKGTPSEFTLTQNFIKHVAQALSINDSNIIITYGNHDLDWSVCRLVPASDPKRKSYQTLAAQVGEVFSPGTPPHEKGPVAGSGIHNINGIRFIVLNSGIECFALDKDSEPFTPYHHGKIGLSQLAWLRRIAPTDNSIDITTVALIHHHLVNIPYPKYSPDISLLAEGAEVRQEFGRIGIDILIHGHRHHPYLHAATELGWQKPISVISAGSYGVNGSHRASGRIPNTFHVVELADRSAAGNRTGRLHSFKQDAADSWIYLTADETNVGIDFIQWFGMPTTDLETDMGLAEIIKGIIPKIGASPIHLPEYESLPLNLKCQRHKKLNRALIEQAKLKGCEVTGKYPSRCAISKIT